MLIYLYLGFEVIAFLTALFQFSKIRLSYYKYFVPYLFFIVLYEIGSYFNWFSINHTNLWAANITMGLSFIFYGLLLVRLLKRSVLKKWITRVIFLSIFLSLINNLFIQGFWNLNTITILVQYGLLILMTCFYFYELMNYKEKLIVIRLPGFWLNTGLLFFCLIQFLFFSAFAYMAYKNNYQYNSLFYVISNIANAILYSCLSISFLCFNKTGNYLH